MVNKVTISGFRMYSRMFSQDTSHTPVIDKSKFLNKIYQQQLNSEKTTGKNHIDLCKRLENIRGQNVSGFKKTFRVLREIDKSSYENAGDIKDLLKTGQANEAACCNETKSLLKEIENTLNKPTKYPEVILQSLVGSAFYKVVIITSQGLLLCMIIGVSFSFLYFVSDVYIYYYRQTKNKGFIHFILYLIANVTRLIFPIGIFSSYLFLLGNIRYGGEKIPFLKLFDQLPTPETNTTSSMGAVTLFRVVKVLNHPFRLFLGLLGLQFTKTRVLLIGHKGGVFAVLLGSTIFLSYFRMKRNQIYYKSKQDNDLKILTGQVVFLTFGIDAFFLVKEEMTYLRKFFEEGK